MKKRISIPFIIIASLIVLAGCTRTTEITVVTREGGSGTRGAFTELFKVEEKYGNGNRKDLITKEAITTNKTDVMITNVRNNINAIGYISLGSLDTSVKALKINGAEPTAENIKNGTYEISRPFVIATKGEATGLKKDFIDFILSKEGQEVVAKDYVSVNDNLAPYSGNKPEGRIVIAGSSSVNPIMEKLKEAYIKINTKAIIEIQQNDSTGGLIATINEVSDIGMSSRALTDGEKEKLIDTVIAIDGIVVIVNSKNNIEELTKEKVREIFTGELTSWDDLK
jgi:phosphate transport system substrate-binding protein